MTSAQTNTSAEALDEGEDLADLLLEVLPAADTSLSNPSTREALHQAAGREISEAEDGVISEPLDRYISKAKNR